MSACTLDLHVFLLLAFACFSLFSLRFLLIDLYQAFLGVFSSLDLKIVGIADSLTLRLPFNVFVYDSGAKCALRILKLLGFPVFAFLSSSANFLSTLRQKFNQFVSLLSKQLNSKPYRKKNPKFSIHKP